MFYHQLFDNSDIFYTFEDARKKYFIHESNEEKIWSSRKKSLIVRVACIYVVHSNFKTFKKLKTKKTSFVEYYDGLYIFSFSFFSPTFFNAYNTLPLICTYVRWKRTKKTFIENYTTFSFTRKNKQHVRILMASAIFSFFIKYSRVTPVCLSLRSIMILTYMYLYQDWRSLGEGI